MAVDSNLGAVVGAEQGVIGSIRPAGFLGVLLVFRRLDPKE